jgi:lipid A 4'-phosphatase
MTLLSSVIDLKTRIRNDGSLAAICLIVGIGVVTGILFAVYPELDIKTAALVHDFAGNGPSALVRAAISALRSYNVGLTAVFLAISASALIIKFVWPRAPMLVPPRAGLLIIFTFALCPGLLANVILKEHWGRPRPSQITEFGGPLKFVPWWDYRGSCRHNCSFVSGEASSAFALLAPAAAIPAPWRGPAIVGALAFGTAVGVSRMLLGRHFLSDVIFAAVFTSLTVWLLYSLLFRWRSTAKTDAEMEGLIAHAGSALKRLFLI